VQRSVIETRALPSGVVLANVRRGMLPLRIALCVLCLSTSACTSCRSSSSRSDAAPEAAAKAVRPRVTVPGETPLDVARSKLSLVVVKDRVSPVAATLSLRDGAIALDASPPTARLSIDLDTFDSGIGIRNERVRNIFFETSAIGWESGELVVPLPKESIDQLRKDHQVHADLAGSLKIHGQTAKVAMTVDAGYAPDGRLWVKSSPPVSLKISDFGLTDNLRRLSAICMHDSIDDMVTVDASLEFSPH
jgi:hypothetical protein